MMAVSGKAIDSSDSAYCFTDVSLRHADIHRQRKLTGVGTSAPVTRSGAASRKSNALDSQIWAMISDPTPKAADD